MTILAVYHNDTKRLLAWMTRSDALDATPDLSALLPVDSSGEPYFALTITAESKGGLPSASNRFVIPKSKLAVAILTQDSLATLRTLPPRAAGIELTNNSAGAVSLSTLPNNSPSLSISNNNLIADFGDFPSLSGISCALYAYQRPSGASHTGATTVTYSASSAKATFPLPASLMPSLAAPLDLEIEVARFQPVSRSYPTPQPPIT